MSSASIFEHGAQLTEQLLQPESRAGDLQKTVNRGSEGARDFTRQPAGVQEPESSLSSRRTLNQVQSGTSEDHQFEAAVKLELSGGGKASMAYHAYEDKLGSMDKEEEEEEGEEVTDSQDELLLAGNFASEMIVNNSGFFRTLPKQYNPG